MGGRSKGRKKERKKKKRIHWKISGNRFSKFFGGGRDRTDETVIEMAKIKKKVVTQQWFLRRSDCFDNFNEIQFTSIAFSNFHRFPAISIADRLQKQLWIFFRNFLIQNSESVGIARW